MVLRIYATTPTSGLRCGMPHSRPSPDTRRAPRAPPLVPRCLLVWLVPPPDPKINPKYGSPSSCSLTTTIPGSAARIQARECPFDMPRTWDPTKLMPIWEQTFDLVAARRLRPAASLLSKRFHSVDAEPPREPDKSAAPRRSRREAGPFGEQEQQRPSGPAGRGIPLLLHRSRINSRR